MSSAYIHCRVKQNKIMSGRSAVVNRYILCVRENWMFVLRARTNTIITLKDTRGIIMTN